MCLDDGVTRSKLCSSVDRVLGGGKPDTVEYQGDEADIEKEDNDKDGDGDDAGNDIEYDPEIHHQLLLKKARGKPTRIDGFPLY